MTARASYVRENVTASRVSVPSLPTMLRSADVDRQLRPTLAPLYHERVVALGLDARGRLRAEIVLAVGGLTGVAIAPRDIMRRVLEVPNVASFILAHNHPSGDPDPSPEDARLTERVAAAAELLGVPMLDHVIVAEGGYFSFADHGLLRAA